MPEFYFCNSFALSFWDAILETWCPRPRPSRFILQPLHHCSPSAYQRRALMHSEFEFFAGSVHLCSHLRVDSAADLISKIGAHNLCWLTQNLWCGLYTFLFPSFQSLFPFPVHSTIHSICLNYLMKKYSSKPQILQQMIICLSHSWAGGVEPAK